MTNTQIQIENFFSTHKVLHVPSKCPSTFASPKGNHYSDFFHYRTSYKWNNIHVLFGLVLSFIRSMGCITSLCISSSFCALLLYSIPNTTSYPFSCGRTFKLLPVWCCCDQRILTDVFLVAHLKCI